MFQYLSRGICKKLQSQGVKRYHNLPEDFYKKGREDGFIQGWTHGLILGGLGSYYIVHFVASSKKF
jgi:hypothetical protein